jgi:sigma-B regulation protein RsbU (phosphoserine phosphatase)
MKKKTVLYVVVSLLAVFAFSAMAMHYRNLYTSYAAASRTAEFPFKYINGEVLSLKPEAEQSGIKLGDHIIAINGRPMDNKVYAEEAAKMQSDQPVTLSMRRKTADGQIENYETKITPLKIERNFNYYSQLIVGLLFTYILPTFCILLGFWVVFVRPQDFLAWILLFVLLGLSSISLEMYSSETLIGVYKDIFFSCWALSMLLFGIYFPERWTVDRKLPWLKWIFIVPLSFQILTVILSLIKLHIGLDLISFMRPLLNVYGEFDFVINLIAIGFFFAALGHKSGTMQNPDARRRLKLMLYGTGVAMGPSFSIILYRLFSGAKGSFFDIVPFWFALFTLLSMLLFPLTMAYVIVVYRAMDVSVVVRQGLQYALAQNGVKVLQFILLCAVVLGVLWIFRSERFSFAEQIGFVAAGFGVIPLIDYAAKNLRVWIDRKFFREAYNAEQILSELSEDVRTMVETNPLLETVSARISESLHVPQIALLLKVGSNFQPAYALGYENPPTIEFSEDDKTVVKLKRNETLTIYQDDEESWVNEEIETGEREKLQKLNSQLLLPIGAKDGLSGVISLSPKRSEEPYTPNDLRLLKSVAAQTGLALENSRLTEAIAREAAQKERLNRELEIAREVQERLFPQELPPTEGLDYIGACRPALGVGGDYYDFLELPDKKFGIAIGDVSGKGIGASLMMASLQASLRGQAIHCGSDLAELMRHVNTLVYEASTSNRYATFFYAQLDIKSRKLIYVNAGHNPPFVLRKNGEVLRLEEGGAVVGMLPTMFINYIQGEVQLEAGDLLVGYTDGISEAMNPAEEEWGEDAMLAELKNVYDKPSEEILNHVVVCADKFANGAKQHDDMTMIIVKII